jgi:hypothetical protein
MSNDIVMIKPEDFTMDQVYQEMLELGMTSFFAGRKIGEVQQVVCIFLVNGCEITIKEPWDHIQELPNVMLKCLLKRKSFIYKYI